MVVCGGGGKAIITGNQLSWNGQCGVKLCHNLQSILVARNALLRNGPIGVSIAHSFGSVEGNLIGAHAEDGIHVCTGSNPFISANRIHGAATGLATCSGAEGRVQGNSLGSCRTGIDLAPAVDFVITGNDFSGNDRGVRFDVRSGPPSARTFGRGNAFSPGMGASYVERASDDEPGVAAHVPSGTDTCAQCWAIITAAKLRCSGCARFGVIYAPCYCGAACQKAHWPAHRAECRRAGERERAREAAFAAAADALLFDSRGDDTGARPSYRGEPHLRPAGNGPVITSKSH